MIKPRGGTSSRELIPLEWPLFLWNAPINVSFSQGTAWVGCGSSRSALECAAFKKPRTSGPGFANKATVEGRSKVGSADELTIPSGKAVPLE
jgi:hypothetical protein